MFPLAKLQADRTHKAANLQDLLDAAEKAGRPLNEDELALFDRLESEIKGLDTQIANILEHQGRRDRLQAMTAQPVRQTSPDNPVNGPSRAPSIPATPRRDARLKAFRGPQAEASAYRAGQWIRASVFNDFRAQEWCVRNGVDIRNAAGTNSNNLGGALVPTEFSQAIIDLREEYGVFRNECEVTPMGRDSMIVPRRASGLTVAFGGENPAAAPTASDVGWNNVQITAKKLWGLALMSSEIAEDAIIGLADWLAREFAYAFAKREDECGFIGDGTSTYGGMRGLGNIFTTTGGVGGAQLVGAVDAASGHDTFAEIDYSDLQTLMSKLPQYALGGAKWYCSSVCMALVFGRIMANAGGNTIQDMQGGYQRSYMGYPIVISQALPTSTGDLSDLPMLYFGNLRLAALLGDRREIRVFPSEHRYMDTDQIAIRATERFDINVHDVGDTTTGNAGPIVALVGE